MSRTLIAEATRRSGVVWVSADGTDPRLVWHLWHDDALWLVGGGDEQELPPLADRAVVVVRSKATQSGRVVEWEADVLRVEPGTPEWDEVVPLLAAERLNAASAEELPARWAAASTVLRLAPRDSRQADAPPSTSCAGGSPHARGPAGRPQVDGEASGRAD